MVLKSVKLFCAVSSQELSINYRIRHQQRHKTFLDKLRVAVKAGNGGNGMPQFGGVGGKGGDVHIKASASVRNLKQVLSKYPEKRFSAGNGDSSARYRIVGKPGTDTVVECPVGVTITNDSKQLIGDLNEDGQSVIVALGGRGGDPTNNFFGQKGQRYAVNIDLKLLADVGLVGFPNAGKSTFLKAVSRAKPKIANYPFTTMSPNLGIMKYNDERLISVADLPGLIEGAHLNVGLGHRFLKHIVRTKLLAFVVDVNGFQIQPAAPFRSAFDTIKYLNQEIKLYDETLLQKPAILIVSKMDTEKSKENYQELLRQLHSLKEANGEEADAMIEFSDIVPISSHNAYNIPHVRNRIRELIDVHFEEQREKTNAPKSFLSIIERERNAVIEDGVTLI